MPIYSITADFYYQCYRHWPLILGSALIKPMFYVQAGSRSLFTRSSNLDGRPKIDSTRCHKLFNNICIHNPYKTKNPRTFISGVCVYLDLFLCLGFADPQYICFGIVATNKGPGGCDTALSLHGFMTDHRFELHFLSC